MKNKHPLIDLILLSVKNKYITIPIFMLLALALFSSVGFSALTDGIIGAWHIDDTSGNSTIASIGFNGFTNATWVKNYNNITNNALQVLGVDSAGGAKNPRMWRANTTTTINYLNDSTVCFWAQLPTTNYAGFWIMQFSAYNSGGNSTLSLVSAGTNTLQIYISDASSASSSGTFAVSNEWAFYCLKTENRRTNLLFYKNAVLVINSSVVARNVGLNSAGMIGFNGAQDTYGSAQYTNFSNVNVWNRSLSQAEITQLNTYSFSGYYPFGVNFSIVANDYYTLNSITNFSALVDTYVYNTTSGSILTTLLLNNTLLHNITIISNQSGGYINITYLNYNISNLLKSFMWQAEAYIGTLSELGTNTNLSNDGGTITAGSQIINNAAGQFFKLAIGNYSMQLLFPDYYPANSSIYNVAALSNFTFDIPAIYNHSANFTVYNLIGNATIQNYTLTLLKLYSLQQVQYNITNLASVLLNVTTGNYSYALSSPNFFTTQGYINFSNNASNQTLYVYPAGYLQVNFINTANVSIIKNALGTILLQNLTNQVNFSAINGTTNISGLNPGSSYNVICQETTGYGNNTQTLLYPSLNSNPPSAFTCFMSPGATTITFTVQDQNQNRLNNVLVQAGQFINGSMTTVCTTVTDITGTAVCQLTQGVYTITTFSIPGYTSVQLINYLSATTYTIQLSQFNQQSPTSNIASFVNYFIQPNQRDLLYNQTMTFNLTTSSFNGVQLTNWGIDVFTTSHVLVASNSSTNSSGGFIQTYLNLRPYNGTILVVEYYFTKQNYTTFTVPYTYYVTQFPYTGTPDELRGWIVTNMDLAYRVFLWIFCTICVTLGFAAYGIRGAVLSGTSLINLGIFGWLFVVQPFLLGFFLTIGGIIVILQLVGAI